MQVQQGPGRDGAGTEEDAPALIRERLVVSQYTTPRGAITAQGIAAPEEFDWVLLRARKSINVHPCRFHFPIAIGQKPA